MTLNTALSHRATQITLSLTGLLVAYLVLNIKTLDWPFGIVDSPIILAQAILYSPLEYFSEPSKYQFLTYNNLTPLVTLSWDIDYTLFQLEPLGFRIHQLTAMAALLGVMYMILYRATGSVLSSTIFCFAALTLPATYAVVDVMVNRHYIEGMLFSLLCFHFAALYGADQRPVMLLASVVCYAISITAKEVYIPLPGLLFFLYPADFRRKVLFILPYAVTLAIYLAWRMFMLSGTGGYTSADASLNLLESAAGTVTLLWILIGSLTSHPALSALLLLLLVVLIATNVKKLSGATLLGLLVAGLGLMLPLLALLPMLAAGFMSLRWVFAPSVAILFLLAYLCKTTSSRLMAGTVYAFVLASSSYAYYERMQAPMPSYAKGKGRIYQGIMRSDPEAYLQIARYSPLSAHGYAIWVYIARLHNGTWGTLTISDGGQLHYHDVSKRQPAKIGKRKPRPWSSGDHTRGPLNVVKRSQLDPVSGTMTIEFIDGLNSANCYVYFFGKDNGFVASTSDCKQWSVQYRELAHKLRMTGYDIAEVSFALWSERADGGFYSRPYAMSELFSLD